MKEKIGVAGWAICGAINLLNAFVFIPSRITDEPSSGRLLVPLVGILLGVSASGLWDSVQALRAGRRR